MTLLLLFILLAFLPFVGVYAASGWTESGEVEYSYAYARTWLGHKMRLDGWRCKVGFTSGVKREMEHSVWEKNGRKMQMMIWRIDVNKTGYSLGEIPKNTKSGEK